MEQKHCENNLKKSAYRRYYRLDNEANFIGSTFPLFCEASSSVYAFLKTLLSEICITRNDRKQPLYTDLHEVSITALVPIKDNNYGIGQERGRNYDMQKTIQFSEIYINLDHNEFWKKVLDADLPRYKSNAQKNISQNSLASFEMVKKKNSPKELHSSSERDLNCENVEFYKKDQNLADFFTNSTSCRQNLKNRTQE